MSWAAPAWVTEAGPPPCVRSTSILMTTSPHFTDKETTGLERLSNLPNATVYEQQSLDLNPGLPDLEPP